MAVHFCARFVLSSAVLFLAVTPLSSQQNQPPNDPAFERQFQQGHAALAAGKYSDAADAFKKANKLQRNSCANCYLGLATAYLRLGELGKVLENSDKAISSSTDDGTRAAAHNLKGHALLAMAVTDKKKFEPAEAEFRLAIELDSKNAALHVSLARTLMKQSKDEEGVQELKKCLALSPDESLAEHARMLIADPRRARFIFAPEFHFTSLQGQEITLKQLQGKIVVFDFWATWCPPCRASVPELKDLTKKYSDGRLVLISVSADSDEKAWRDFVAKKSMDWPQFLDTERQVIGAFSVQAYPTYFVIDGDGIIRQRIEGLNPQESVVHRLKSTLETLPQLRADKND